MTKLKRARKIFFLAAQIWDMCAQNLREILISGAHFANFPVWATTDFATLSCLAEKKRQIIPDKQASVSEW